MDYQGGDPNSNGHVNNGEIRLRVADGSRKIVFTIESGRHDLKWAADPIWVSADDCPKVPSCHGDIQDPVVDEEARTLTVTDNVSTRGKLHYSLNFLKDGKSKRRDPIIIHD
ncbi:MAG: hypothetical protein M3428_01260 [Pseudomonadota bacterium]|nr:hypothetical protein [Pseudomonadota bacterium]